MPGPSRASSRRLRPGRAKRFPRINGGDDRPAKKTFLVSRACETSENYCMCESFGIVGKEAVTDRLLDG